MSKKILLVAVELADVAPVGGVAEYILGLAAALLKRGHDVRVTLPAYQHLLSREDPQLEEVMARLTVPVGVGASEVTAVHQLQLPCPGDDSIRLPVLLLGSHKHFASVQSARDIYGWPDPEPWIAFSRAVVEYVNAGDWRPDVVHCHDAHTALIPAYVKHLRDLPRNPDDAPPHITRARTLLTIHNMLDKGLGDPELVSYAGLPMDWFSADRFEYYGMASCFKAGLVSADRVSTVSRTYATEISTLHKFGQGLEGVLAPLGVTGIVNGIDESRWRMEDLAYDGKDDISRLIAAKRSQRGKLYRRWGWKDLDRPLISFRGRWDTQKFVAAVADGAEEIAKVANLLVVTWGYPGSTGELREAWKKLNAVAAQRPGRLLVNPPGIDDIRDTAKHYAMSDFFLMPSRYEPCGLAQMECQRFGTVPIVRRTGGLADTVSEQQMGDLPSPNGFVFEEEDWRSMLEAVERAVKAFDDPDAKAAFIANTLRQENSWHTRVPAYEDLYESHGGGDGGE
jgi:starch synthase